MDALVVKPRARGDTAFVPVLSSLTFSTAAISPHDANKISSELQAMTEGKEGLVKFAAMKSTTSCYGYTQRADDSITPNGRLVAKKMAGLPTLKQVYNMCTLKKAVRLVRNPASV